MSIETSTEKLLGLMSSLNEEVTKSATNLMEANSIPFVYSFTVFILACFVGYYVVLKVTPALHSPLMAVTNAISSVIVLGGILAAGGSFSEGTGVAEIFGFIAVFLASINIVGGFFLTHRMLSMFSKKK